MATSPKQLSASASPSAFVKAFFHHFWLWTGLILCGTLSGVLQWYGMPTSSSIATIGFVVALLIGTFFTWKDEAKERLRLADLMTPSYGVKCTLSIEGCEVTNTGVRYFRALLHSTAKVTVRNCKAYVVAVRGDGVAIPIPDPVQLCMQGESVADIIPTIPRYLDIVCWPHDGVMHLRFYKMHPSVDLERMFISRNVFEIDIVISAECVPTRKFTFEYIPKETWEETHIRLLREVSS